MSMIGIFDVIGPNMIGPSSSHTAGACKIGLLAKKMFADEIANIKFVLFGSFAQTYRGHGTDRALLGGIMGFDTDDARIRDSFDLATESGLQYVFEKNTSEKEVHPNTVDILMENKSGKKMSVRGVSTGGGKVKIVQINSFKVDFTGEYSTIITSHSDKPGVVAYIAKCLSDENVNIAFMKLFRESKGDTAFCIVEFDGKVSDEIVDEIDKNKYINDIMLIEL